MLRNALLLASLSLGSLGLAGCHLYFDDGTGDETEPGMWPDDCVDRSCEPDGVPPNGDLPDGGEADPTILCETDVDCADGCYCTDDGTCEESGFCRLNVDCAESFACNDAGTCIPVGDPTPPATCEDLSTDEAACLDSADCSPIYRGVDCTSESGEPCTGETANCTCESFSFDSCEDA